MWYEIDGFWNSTVEEKLQKYWSDQVHEDIFITFKNQNKTNNNPPKPSFIR